MVGKKEKKDILKGVVGDILIICVSNIAEIEVGKKTNYCVNFSSVFPII